MERRFMEGNDEEDVVEAEAGAPSSVTAVPRLKQDVESLSSMMAMELPPKRLVRGGRILVAKYGFGDASGVGFGASWSTDKGVEYRYGVWGSDNIDKSSNYREMRNLVETVELMEENGDLNGIELFLFTDNSVAEAAMFKGSSSSRLLFELVLRLKKIEVRSSVRIHFIHVAGTRMIKQGADGLSRGNLLEGVMQGRRMVDFIPITTSAIELQGSLAEWISSWLPSEGKEVEVLTPKGWFLRGHDVVGFEKNCDGFDEAVLSPGYFVWSPPPAVAEAVVEELRKARHKRQRSTHVFVCQKLMKPSWLGQLYKVADIVMEIKPGVDYWDSTNHESLILAVCFPFISHCPWQLRNQPRLLEVGRVLRRVWKESEGTEGHILRKLCEFTRTLEGMSASVVWRLLQSRSLSFLSDRTTRKRSRKCMEEEER